MLLGMLPLVSEAAGTPTVPDKSDGEVLEATLLHLWADRDFGMNDIPTNAAVTQSMALVPYSIWHSSRANNTLAAMKGEGWSVPRAGGVGKTALSAWPRC